MGIRINFGRTGRGLLPPLCSAPTAKPQLITERWALLKVWRPNSTTTQFMTTKHNVLLLSECGQRWKAPSRFQTLEVREHEPSHRYCKKMVVGWSPCIHLLKIEYTANIRHNFSAGFNQKDPLHFELGEDIRERHRQHNS